ncbi:MAG: hypothetical protein IPO99_07270 [Nitrospira sp.]|nr:hypothetical protein [Nitrospira sp.]
MQVRRTGVYTLCAIVMMVAVVSTTVGAEEQSAGEAAGAGQRLRDVEARRP